MRETSSFNNAASSMKNKIFWAKILAEILSDYSTREHTLTKLVRTAECVKMLAGEIKLYYSKSRERLIMIELKNNV